MEGKEILPPDQTGCKRGMGTLDNINVLNYLINRQVEKGRGVIMFVDCKAAFDSVDRGKMVRAMRERGIREDLVRRCEMLRETKGRVRVGERVYALAGRLGEDKRTMGRS